MKIYISGRISGTKDHRERFARAAETIRAKGHEAINPAEMNRILNPATTTWEEFMLADLGLLRACAAVVFLPGWRNSRGACIEYREAKKLGLKIYTSLEGIPRND